MVSATLIVLMFVIALYPMAWETATGRFDFFDPKNPFVVYYLVQLGVSGALTLAGGTASIVGLDPLRYVGAYERALALSTIGLVAFQVGYYGTRPRAFGIPAIVTAPWYPARVPLVVAGLVAVGLLAGGLLVGRYGGLAGFAASREQFRAGGMSGQGYLIFPATSALAVATLVVLTRPRPEGRNRLGAKERLMVALSLAPAIVIGFRSFVILPLVQYMVAVHFRWRPLRARSVFVGGGALLLLFTAYGIWRTVPPGVDRGAVVTSAMQAVSAQPELLYSVVARSKGTEVVASVMHALDETGEYRYGWASVIEATTIVLPRSLWRGKPRPIVSQFATQFFGDIYAVDRGIDPTELGGISPTIVGELYWHFGWPGVIGGLLLLGSITRRAYATIVANGHSAGVVTGYAILFTTVVMFAESVQGFLNALFMFVLTLYAVFVALSIPLASGAPSATTR